jgi:hypothetical protein
MFSVLGFVIGPSAPPKVNDEEERLGLEGAKGLGIGGGIYEDLVIGLPLFPNDKVSAPNVEVDAFPYGEDGEICSLLEAQRALMGVGERERRSVLSFGRLSDDATDSGMSWTLFSDRLREKEALISVGALSPGLLPADVGESRSGCGVDSDRDVGGRIDGGVNGLGVRI